MAMEHREPNSSFSFQAQYTRGKNDFNIAWKALPIDLINNETNLKATRNIKNSDILNAFELCPEPCNVGELSRKA
jgi:hypothetical protein